MANRFGMFYDKKTGKSYTSSSFSQEYIPKAHSNTRSSVHAAMYEESRKKIAVKRKKESDKETREKKKKKKWVEAGCGHRNLKDMFNCTHSHLNLSDRSVPVTTEKRNLKESSGSGNDSEDMSENSDSENGSIEELSPEYRLK